MDQNLIDLSNRSFELIRQRDYEGALKLWRENTRWQDDKVYWGGYVSILICAGELEEARSAYSKALALQAFDSANNYLNAGATEWVLGEAQTATEHWRRAMKCAYGDSAGNISPGLILYYAAIRSNDNKLLSLSRDHIESRLKTGWSRNWPAPLGRFLIGAADEEHVLKELAREHPQRQPDEFCRWDFYRGVKLLENDDENGFLSCMRSAVDRPDQITWTTEFVLARHELGETPRLDQ